MFNPCTECYRKFGKQYTPECDNECEFAQCGKILKGVLISSYGCFHCTHRNCDSISKENCCSIVGCNNYEKYQIDINRVIKDYALDL